MNGYRVAIVGATGMVGQEFIKVLEQRSFPVATKQLFASDRSAGKKLYFNHDELEVKETAPDSFKDVDIALFSAGAEISRYFAPIAARSGAVVIDNSAAFRMDPTVPLVVPEINPDDIPLHKGIIANPNCSTIQMVVVLDVLRSLAPIRRVVVSTYQAASGAGQAAMDELYGQTGDFLAGRELVSDAFAHRIAFNCIPQIDVFLEDGSTKEEWKMIAETRKILGISELPVSATCVRVPVLRCHSEAVNVEFSAPVTVDAAREALAAARGVTLLDDPATKSYPMPALLEGTDDCYVGRLRVDPSADNGLQLWIVADQLRKGAALNTVQIAEELLRR
jgi:aspartate-semialdehyde dehydrogenase